MDTSPLGGGTPQYAREISFGFNLVPGNKAYGEIRSGLREIRDWAAGGGRKPGFRVLKTARNQAFPPFLVVKTSKFSAPAAQQSNSLLNLNREGRRFRKMRSDYGK